MPENGLNVHWRGQVNCDIFVRYSYVQPGKWINLIYIHHLWWFWKMQCQVMKARHQRIYTLGFHFCKCYKQIKLSNMLFGKYFCTEGLNRSGNHSNSPKFMRAVNSGRFGERNNVGKKHRKIPWMAYFFFFLSWVAESIECPTLDFCSGHDLRVLESSLRLGSALSRESAWVSPSPAPPLHALHL